MNRLMKRWWRTASTVAILVVLAVGARASLMIRADPPGDPAPVPLPGFEIMPGILQSFAKSPAVI